MEEAGISEVEVYPTPTITPSPSTPFPLLSPTPSPIEMFYPTSPEGSSSGVDTVPGPSCRPSSSKIHPPGNMSRRNTASRKRKTPDDGENLFSLAIDKLSTLPEETEHTSFGKVVAFKLQRMDKQQAHIAENIINNALFLGGLGSLNTKACIVMVNGPNDYEMPKM